MQFETFVNCWSPKRSNIVKANINMAHHCKKIYPVTYSFSLTGKFIEITLLFTLLQNKNWE